MSVAIAAVSFLPWLLPKVGFYLLLPAILCSLNSPKPAVRFMSPVLAGLLWATAFGHGLNERQISPQLEGIELQLEGKVIGLPDLDFGLIF